MMTCALKTEWWHVYHSMSVQIANVRWNGGRNFPSLLLLLTGWILIACPMAWPKVFELPESLKIIKVCCVADAETNRCVAWQSDCLLKLPQHLNPGLPMPFLIRSICDMYATQIQTNTSQNGRNKPKKLPKYNMRAITLLSMGNHDCIQSFQRCGWVSFVCEDRHRLCVCFNHCYQFPVSAIHPRFDIESQSPFKKRIYIYTGWGNHLDVNKITLVHITILCCSLHTCLCAAGLPLAGTKIPDQWSKNFHRGNCSPILRFEVFEVFEIRGYRVKIRSCWCWIYIHKHSII